MSTGQLASEPLQLSASVLVSGSLRLAWRPPVSDGYVPLEGYEARCGGAWTAVAATALSTELVAPALPAGSVVGCEARAVNAVGAGPAAQTSLTLL